MKPVPSGVRVLFCLRTHILLSMSIDQKRQGLVDPESLKCISYKTLFSFIPMAFWLRVWHFWDFRYERISKYIFVEKIIRPNMLMYSCWKNHTNEYLNKFVTKYVAKQMLEYSDIWIVSTQNNTPIYSGKDPPCTYERSNLAISKHFLQRKFPLIDENVLFWEKTSCFQEIIPK